MIQAITNYWNWLRTHYLARLILLSALVGVAAGLGALVFNLILNIADRIFMYRLVGYNLPVPGSEGVTVLPGSPTHHWLFLVIPARPGGCCRVSLCFGWRRKLKVTEPTPSSTPFIGKEVQSERGLLP